MANKKIIKIKKNKPKTEHFQMCWLANLASAAGKLGETIIKNGIGVDVNRFTLPWKSQHGFCKGNCCLGNSL